MKHPSIVPAVLAGLSIILFAAVLALGGGTVLYEASDDAFSPSHKDSGVVSVMTTEEAETILPLMADIISQSYNVVIEIDAKDFEYSNRELASYENLVNRLKANNAKIKLGNTDINDFRQSAEDLNIALDVLNADVARLEELKQEIVENAGNTSALFSLYSEVQVLSREISLTAETYAETAEIMIEVAKGYNLATSQLVWAIDIVNKLADASLSGVGSLVPGSSGSSALQILFTLSADTLAYGDTLVIDGSSRLSGMHEIYLDNAVWGTVNLTEPGSFTKSFKIGQITEGLHIISIRCQGQVSKLGYFTVVTTPTSVFISSAKVSGNTVTITGGLQTEGGLFVSGAKIDVYADGIGILGTNTTNKNGVFTVQTELEDGEYQVYAEFFDRSFPLEESVSEQVTVKITNPLLFLILGVAVLGAAAFGSIRFFRKRKSAKVPEVSVFEAEILDAVKPSPSKKIVKAIRKIISGTAEKEDTDKLRVLYRETVHLIASQESIQNTEVKTPREILQEVSTKSDTICQFMEKYEYLHYADVPVSETDLEMMRTLAAGISEEYHENNT